METSSTEHLRKNKTKEIAGLTLTTLNMLELWRGKYGEKKKKKQHNRKGAKNNNKKASFISLFLPLIFLCSQQK